MSRESNFPTLPLSKILEIAYSYYRYDIAVNVAQWPLTFEYRQKAARCDSLGHKQESTSCQALIAMLANLGADRFFGAWIEGMGIREEASDWPRVT
jgi:hypothetical protein